MEYYIAVFWSRTEAFSYANLLKKNNIPSAMIPTPREAGRTCGISVKILPEYIQEAKFLISRTRNSSFGGFLTVFYNQGKRLVVKE